MFQRNLLLLNITFHTFLSLWFVVPWKSPRKHGVADEHCRFQLPQNNIFGMILSFPAWCRGAYSRCHTVAPSHLCPSFLIHHASPMFISLRASLAYRVVVYAPWVIRRVRFGFNSTKQFASLLVIIGQWTSFTGTDPSEWEMLFSNAVILWWALQLIHPLYHQLCSSMNSMFINY